MNKVNKLMPGTMNLSPSEMQMRFVTGELQGLRAVISYLWDGNMEAFNILTFIKGNYREWPAMVMYMKANHLRGEKLVQAFKNESPDGGGYHMAATFILSRIKGLKTGTTSVKIDELI